MVTPRTICRCLTFVVCHQVQASFALPSSSYMDDGNISHRNDGLFTALTSLASVVLGMALVVLLSMACASREKSKTPTVKSPEELQDEVFTNETGSTNHKRVSMEANPVYLLKKRNEEEKAKKEEKVKEVAALKSSSTADGIIGDSNVDEDEQANVNYRVSQNRARALVKSMHEDSVGKNQLTFTSATPWLHFGIRKGDSVQALESHPKKQDGLYLVRAKRPEAGMYALDVLHLIEKKFVVENYLIVRSKTGIFEVDGRLSKSGSRTLEEVVLELHGSSNLIKSPLTHGIPAAVDAAEENSMIDEEA